MAQIQEYRRKHYDSLPTLEEGKTYLLLGAFYSGDEQTIYLRFYDHENNIIRFWSDKTNHKPFCLARMDFADKIKDVIINDTKFTPQTVSRFDPIFDSDTHVLKITAPDPLSITGFRDRVPCHEADIKYHDTYLSDRGLIVGMYYSRRGDNVVPYSHPISSNVELALKNLMWDKIRETGKEGSEYRGYITKWANLLNQPIPDIKRAALDIEVQTQQGKMPKPIDHDKPITAISIVGSDGLRKVFVLNIVERNESLMPPEAEICLTEKEMIDKTFEIIKSYPILLTFNGDDFDLPYLYMRAQDPRISPDGSTVPKEQIPIIVKRETFEKFGMQSDPVGIHHGIHLDLYRIFSNPSIQGYAFSGAYKEHTLAAVSEGILNDTKMEFDGEIVDLPMQMLAAYCLKDSELTYRLTSHNDNLLMKLLIVISRIGRISVDDISRTGVNQWIKGILYFEHRQRGELIPSRRELEAKGGASNVAVIDDKQYRGADVLDPVSGVHFNVSVLDFASLYPSIIKLFNLSHETVNCIHHECKNNIIEGTTHWACTKKKGIVSLLIGSLRDLRVSYYKHLSKDKSLPQEERQLYVVVSQALKVILNASYGVLAFPSFPLLCLPVADCVAALGRAIIGKTIKKAKEMGIPVLYSDTDSIFCENPDPVVMKQLIEWAKNTFGVDLEVDKEYRYAIFSSLKKNYLGVRHDGTADIKGLTGKKSHTPPFIRSSFYRMLDILGEIRTKDDFVMAKERINFTVRDNYQNIMAGKIPLQEMIFSMTINKPINSYGVGDGSMKGLPQHIKAAKMLADSTGREINAGEKILFIKTKSVDGVKPLKLANVNDVDTEKYLEMMEAVFDQILSVLDIDFKTVLGKPKPRQMDQAFFQ